MGRIVVTEYMSVDAKRLRLAHAKTVDDGIHILVYERAGARA
jgi:hypothetical protein